VYKKAQCIFNLITILLVIITHTEVSV